MFFVNEFTAQDDGCSLGLTDRILGDMVHIRADGRYIARSGSYVASAGDLKLDAEWQGFTKGIFGSGGGGCVRGLHRREWQGFIKGIFGSSLFMLRTLGTGDLFVEGRGGVRRAVLEDGEEMPLDNHHLVAMEAGVRYDIRKHGSVKMALLGGKALVMRLPGLGTIHYQTKNLVEFARAIVPCCPSGGRRAPAAGRNRIVPNEIPNL